MFQLNILIIGGNINLPSYFSTADSLIFIYFVIADAPTSNTSKKKLTRDKLKRVIILISFFFNLHGGNIAAINYLLFTGEYKKLDRCCSVSNAQRNEERVGGVRMTVWCAIVEPYNIETQIRRYSDAEKDVFFLSVSFNSRSCGSFTAPQFRIIRLPSAKWETFTFTVDAVIRWRYRKKVNAFERGYWKNAFAILLFLQPRRAECINI